MATAWKAFSKLRRRATATPKRNEHYKRFQAVAATILNLHPVPESTAEDPAELDDPRDVEVTLRESLDPPASVFGDEFFTSALYPLTLLYDVGGLYQIQSIGLDFHNGLTLSEAEQDDKKIQAVYWLCYMLDMSPGESRGIIDEFKNSRRLNGISSNNLATAPVLAPATPSTTAEPTIPPPLIDASPPAPSTLAIDNKDATAGFQHVDAGRQERLENLHHRNRRESASDYTAIAKMKKSVYITSHFYKKQFTGALTQSIAVTLRDYRHASGLYKLDPDDMANNFALALEDPAKDFFLSTVQPGMSFDEISNLMLAEYNSNSRQIQVRRTTRTRLASFVKL